MSARDLCIMACVFCRDPLFKQWICEQAEDSGVTCEINDAGAKAYILTICGVESRNDLDKDEAAGLRFHKLVREPFMAWKEARHVD